jgi:CheY-like chemotaxis protein
MDGYEVARQLRARPGTAATRFVALTGYGQPEDHARSRQAGFEYHLIKPVAPDVLRSLLSADNGRRPAAVG